MPTEFAAFRLKTMQREDMLSATDILGRVIDYTRQKPVIFLANIANMHWNLIRVQHWPIKELQLFEPMGKPPARQSKHNGYGGNGSGSSSSGGISMRYIPQHIIHWLDTCWPLRGHYARCARVRGLKAAASALDGDEDDDYEGSGHNGSNGAASSSSTSSSFPDEPQGRPSRGRSPAPLATAPSSAASSSSNGKNGKHGSKNNGGSSSSSSTNGNGNGGGSGASSSPPLLSLSDDPLTWLRRTTSAITSQHQMNGFDCGV